MYSDSIVKSNPKLGINIYNQGIKIVWQDSLDNYYRIAMRNYLDDTLSSKIIIKDSLVNSPEISLSTYRIVWQENGKLYCINFYPNLSNPFIIDTGGCFRPNIMKNDNLTGTQILYVKKNEGNQLVFLAKYNDYPNPNWKFDTVSFGNNRNANFGIYYGISFETLENNVFKIKYSPSSGTDYFDITENVNCNYKNPYVFSYPVTTGSTNNKTPFFVAFDTDSLENNNEVLIKTFYYGMYDSLINISGMEGKDYKPKVSYLGLNDTIYAAIFWLHEENSKTNIWISKEVFDPLYSSVEDVNIGIKSYELFQNYPNPFNPGTTIEFNIKESSKVNLKVYDILGNYITTLLDTHLSSGIHKVEFKGNNLSSGIYFYTLDVDGNTKTKSMILLK